MRSAVLALLLLTPLAMGGTAQAPEAADPEGDAVAWADIVAAWFSVVDGELVVSWRVADASGLPDDACFNADFTVDGVTWVLYATIDDNGLRVTQRRPGVDLVDVGERDGDVFRVAYDGGLFPLDEEMEIRFLDLWSCRTPNTRVDVVAPGAVYRPAGPLFTPPAPGAVRTGSFLVGHAGTFASDACIEPTQEGIDSNCFAPSATESGAAYALELTGTHDAVLQVCFYRDGGFLMYCEYALNDVIDVLPRHATRVGVSAFAGAAVEWSMRF